MSRFSFYQKLVWVKVEWSHCDRQLTGEEWGYKKCEAGVLQTLHWCSDLSADWHDQGHLPFEAYGRSLVASDWRTELYSGKCKKNTLPHSLQNISLSQHAIVTWHCPGLIVPMEGFVLKCGNLRNLKFTGSWVQRFCRAHNKSTRWPVTQVRKLKFWEGLWIRDTGSPEPVTANSTPVLPERQILRF